MTFGSQPGNRRGNRFLKWLPLPGKSVLIVSLDVRTSARKVLQGLEIEERVGGRRIGELVAPVTLGRDQLRKLMEKAGGKKC
jgi:hypothetical protein